MHGYYDLAFVRQAYETRLSALRRLIPTGSSIIDLGCNDARMARALLRTGHARSVVAVDIKAVISGDMKGIEFIRADLGDASILRGRSADAVLMLNVLHHVMARSVDAGRQLVTAALDTSELVLIDLGSFTESGPWPWRAAFDRHWRNDAEMWADLFGKALQRRPVARYPAQGPGSSRTLWALTGHGHASG